VATRFYLPDGGSGPAGWPAPTGGPRSSEWDNTGGWSQWTASTTKTNTTLAAGAPRSKGSTTSNADRLDRVYVTAPLTAQTIAAGTFSAVIRAVESATGADFWLQIIITVWASDGVTQRGTIYAGSTAITESATAGAENQEFGTTSSTRIKNAIATSSVVCQDGDRIQIEIGARGNGTTSTHTFTLRYGDETARSDFTLTAGDTTELVPWVELSQNLTWQSVPVTGDGALTTSPVELSGTGTLRIDGTGAFTAPAAELSGTGTVRVTGTGALTASATTLSGAGTLSLAGTGALTVPVTTLSGTGVVRVTGTGALTAPAVTLTGEGSAGPPSVAGAGALITPAVLLSGAGTLRIAGIGALTTSPVELSGEGILSLAGVGELTAPLVELSGEGVLSLTGVGELTAPPVELSGSGTVIDPSAYRDITLHVGEMSTRSMATGELTARSLNASLATRSLNAVLEE
jgi:hypothetical protein